MQEPAPTPRNQIPASAFLLQTVPSVWVNAFDLGWKALRNQMQKALYPYKGAEACVRAQPTPTK
eukprot:2557627-Rhodomonas_salina.2